MIGIGGESRVERDWKSYGVFRKDEEALFLERIKEAVWSLPPPWEGRRGGRPAYPARGLVMAALLKVKFKKDYRGLESHLRVRGDILRLMELERAPSKSALHAAVKRLPEGYVKRLNDLLVEPLKGGV